MRTLLLLFVVVIGLAQGQDLNELIDQVFRPNTTTETAHVDQFQGNGGSAPCECVPYYLCMNNSIITNGVGLIDIRIQEGGCVSYLDVCCQPPNISPNPPPRPDTTGNRRGCGYRHPDGVGFRITGDANNEAQFGEFPWMVAILREEIVDDSPDPLNVYQCGGALIHREVVLTAAHCVHGKNVEKLKIRAGEWDTQTKNEVYPHQDRNVREMVVHTDYHAGTLRNDIALLFLSEPVDFAENVDIVCLPNQGEIIDSTKCLASGWGKDVFALFCSYFTDSITLRCEVCNRFQKLSKCKEGRYQVILKKVELPIVPVPSCVTALRKTRLGPYFQFHDSFICAGGKKGADTCRGDGGSPLVCPLRNNPDRYVEAGIVAWGIGCGEDGTPGVYVNVAKFRHWINEQMVYQNLDVNAYDYQAEVEH